MIRTLCFLLSVLHVSPATATNSEVWKSDTSRSVNVSWGMCARIPCKFVYPPRLADKSRTAIWFNGNTRSSRPVAFHSKKKEQVASKFQHRTYMVGSLTGNDCSLVINNIRKEDEGYYYFRIEFGGKDNYSFFPATQLLVSNWTEQPSISPVVLDAGKPVNISCTVKFNCNALTPNLTWVFSTNVLRPPLTKAINQRDTWTFTSLLPLTPGVKNHGQRLGCRVSYAYASSTKTVTLTVRSLSSEKSSLIVALATAAAVVFLIISSAVIGLIIKARWRTDRPAGCASRPASREASRLVRWRKREMQDEAPKRPETKPKVNEYQDVNIYANCLPAESSIYGNI